MLNSTNLFEFFGNYTREHREQIQPGNGNELRHIGENLFGVKDFKCSISRGTCEPIPTCDTIAMCMNVDYPEQQTEANVEELKRRVLLAKVLEEQ